MKKNVLVCGATGFIGRNVAEALAKRDDLKVYGTYFGSEPLKNEKIRMIKADLTMDRYVIKAVRGKDVIIQCAATCSGSKDIFARPYYHFVDNVVINPLIFRAAHENNVEQVIFPSCTTMYNSSDKLIKESDVDLNRGVPENYFGTGWSKILIEKACELFALKTPNGKTKFTVFRHSNIYGPYDKYDLERSHVFGATMTKVMTAPEGGTVLVWGTGEEERDLLHVSDIVRFVELALEKQTTKFELVNVGCGSSISVANLVKMIIEVSGKNLKIEYDSTKPTIKTKIALDYLKAKEIFGWEPKISLKDGIKMTLDWYEKNILKSES